MGLFLRDFSPNKTCTTTRCVRESFRSKMSERDSMFAPDLQYHARLRRYLGGYKTIPALRLPYPVNKARLPYLFKKMAGTGSMELCSVLSKTSDSSQYELALFFPP